MQNPNHLENFKNKGGIVLDTKQLKEIKLYNNYA